MNNDIKQTKTKCTDEYPCGCHFGEVFHADGKCSCEPTKQDWEEEFESKRDDFHKTYNGGWNEEDTNEAFHHGMNVGFDGSKDFIKQVRQQAIKETIALFDEAITDTFFESELKSECYSSLKKRLRIIKNSLTQSELKR